MGIVFSGRSSDRTQEIKSELVKILLPDSSETPDRNVRNYLEKIVNMHFDCGSTRSGSVINIPVDPATPMKALEHLIGLYVDQTPERSNSGERQTLEAWCREWKNRQSEQTADRGRESTSAPVESRRSAELKDDRELMITLGGGRAAFLPESSGVSYHIINVAGQVRVFSVGELIQRGQSDSFVHLTRTPKGHYTLELDSTEGIPGESHVLSGVNSNIATMIIGPRDKEKNEGNGVKIWTAHAGLPMKPLPTAVDKEGDFVFGTNSEDTSNLLSLRNYLLEQLRLPVTPESSPLILTVHQASALLGNEYVVRLPEK
jgi:hypothetical protein